MKNFQVYWNRHKNIWSIRINGRVIMHANELMLTNCKFKVGKKGRERCIRTRVRNVHAYATGDITLDKTKFPTDVTIPVCYNPFMMEHFMANNKPIYECEYAIFDSKGRVSAKI